MNSNTFRRALLASSSSVAARTRTTTTARRSFHTTLPKATTIVCVRKNGQVCLMGDGMASQGSMIVKSNVVKVRKIIPKGETDEVNATLVGFAGSTADAFTLLERLEGKLDEYPGQLARSCVELAKGWRTDKYLRRLEASLIVADAQTSLELTGNGDVLESNDGILGVGSGSPYAIAASRALIDMPDMTAEQVAQKAMKIAADMCVHTNHEFLTLKLEPETAAAKEEEETKTKKGKK